MKEIILIKDGPYVVKEYDEIKGTETYQEMREGQGHAYSFKDRLTLCRCGKSSSLPYCDGTHVGAGFEADVDGKEVVRKAYTGTTITVFYKEAICAGAEECIRNCPEVFNPNVKPWIQPDQVQVDRVIETIKKCPSGALSYQIHDEVVENFGQAERISFVKNGPYCVCGKAQIINPKKLDQTFETVDHFTLCRCGESKNKPFCDASHWEHPFEHKGHDE